MISLLLTIYIVLMAACLLSELALMGTSDPQYKQAPFSTFARRVVLLGPITDIVTRLFSPRSRKDT